MSFENEKREDRRKRIAKWGAVVGAVLALACHFAPSDYQAICEAASKIVPAACM